jgi:hypothetical protein
MQSLHRPRVPPPHGRDSGGTPHRAMPPAPPAQGPRAPPRPPQHADRSSVVAAGEGRSSNRSKWATAPSDGAPAAPAAPPPAAAAPAEQLPTPSEVVWTSVDAARPLFESIDVLVHFNLARVQKAFRAARVGPHHFAGSTGYGHGDLGR